MVSIEATSVDQAERVGPPMSAAPLVKDQAFFGPLTFAVYQYEDQL
jgi:hypothetical protein